MDADDFVTLSVRREFAPPAGVTTEDTLRGFLSALTAGLRGGGCTMIGHIKGMLEDGGPSPIFFSVTSLRGDPQMKGGPVKQESGLILSMTVIAAGIEGTEADRLLEETLAGHMRPAS